MAKSKPKGTAAEKTEKSGTNNKTAATEDQVTKLERACFVLKQASDMTRLHVLMILDRGERNVSGICEDMGGKPQPACSHHLALLRTGNLIEPKRRGKFNFYRLTDAGKVLVDTVRPLVG